MADSSEEKTEQPTAKRRKDQRKEGNVLQSKEVVTAFSLIVIFYAFRLLYPITKKTVTDAIEYFFSLIGTKDTVVISDMSIFFKDGCIAFIKAAIPILLIAGIASIIPTIAQTRGYVNFKLTRPKFNRMNLFSGLKKMVSLKGLFQILISVIKIIVLFYIIYTCIKAEITVLPKMIDMTAEEAVGAIGRILWNIIKKSAIAYAVIAGFDFLYQRWSYEKGLKMTKQEVKEEYKNMEGDPKVKGKIKAKQRQMSRQRIMQAVPQADVVIRNPTHYAVALKYDAEMNNAPIVVAKGADSLALKIVEIAEQYNITILENKPLARALYDEVDIDREIPQEFYGPVAEVLAYVYSLKEKDMRKP